MPASALSPLHSRLMAKPGQACFRAAEQVAKLAVDAAAGTISGVSLLTANTEAKGWFMWVDAKTVTQFAALLDGRKLKAYATHGEWGRDGTLDEVGLWSASRVDTTHLRADFKALAAWRKHHLDDFDTLFELATEAPAEFGASLNFRYKLAWVRQDGTDVPCEIAGWNYEDDCPRFEPSAPADAVRFDLPSVRPYKVSSADFVDEPAANDEGLFRSTPPVDATGNGVAPIQSPNMKLSEIIAKFSAQADRLARAVKFHDANPTATMEQLEAHLRGEDDSAELAQLRTGAQTAKVEFGKIDQAGFKAAGDKSPVDVLLAEHAAFKTKAAAHDTDIAALKAAGFEAKDGKSALDLALAANKKLADDIATLRSGGTPAVETGAKVTSPDTATLSGARRAGAAFSAQFKSKPANN